MMAAHTGSIPSRWLGLNKTSRFDAHYWLAVRNQVVANGLDPQTATDDEVRQAITEVETHATNQEQLAKQKRASAQLLLEEARSIENSHLKPTR
jgi:hypothetical protein